MVFVLFMFRLYFIFLCVSLFLFVTQRKGLDGSAYMAESMPASSLTVLKFIENAQNVPQSVCFLTEFISVF